MAPTRKILLSFNQPVQRSKDPLPKGTFRKHRGTSRKNLGNLGEPRKNPKGQKENPNLQEPHASQLATHVPIPLLGIPSLHPGFSVARHRPGLGAGRRGSARWRTPREDGGHGMSLAPTAWGVAFKEMGEIWEITPK